MAKLEIKKYGDKILRKKTQEVKEINQDIKQLSLDMLETMYAAPGVGLAAPQVGIPLRMCVIDISPEKNEPLVLVNPHIIKAEEKIIMQEGCLSFPGFYEDIKRFNKISVEFLNLYNKTEEIEADDFLAKAIQHEIDHLDAKLFIDYLPEWRRKLIEKEIKRKKKAGQW